VNPVSKIKNSYDIIIVTKDNFHKERNEIFMGASLAQSRMEDLYKYLVEPITCVPGTSLSELTETLAKNNIGCMVIVDAEKKPLVFLQKEIF